MYIYVIYAYCVHCVYILYDIRYVIQVSCIQHVGSTSSIPGSVRLWEVVATGDSKAKSLAQGAMVIKDTQWMPCFDPHMGKPYAILVNDLPWFIEIIETHGTSWVTLWFSIALRHETRQQPVCVCAFGWLIIRRGASTSWSTNGHVTIHTGGILAIAFC